MTVLTGRTIPPVSAIADVLALWGHDGWLTPPLSPVVAAAEPIIGLAQTVSVTAGSTGPGLAPIYDVLSSDLSDRFVVIAGAALVPGATFGEILALAAHTCGALGVLVEGNVRDRPAMSALGMPVYALDQCVVGPNGNAHVVGVGQPVTVAGTTIDVDDHIVVDATGCVRIASPLLSDVLEAATRYAAAEDLVVAAIGEGQPLASAYRHKKSIVDELRR